MAKFRLSQVDGGTRYYYHLRPVAPYGTVHRGFEATSTREPVSFEAACFYGAFVYLWPHIFGPGHDPYGFHFEREDPRNSDTVRIYFWEGTSFTVEKLD